MKSISSRYLIIMLFFTTFVGTIQAEYQVDNEDCCFSRCYECGCNPLYPCSWGLQVSAGVRPTLWRHRGSFLTVNCLSSTVLNDIGELPKFRDLYKLPWQVGVQASYAWSCNTNVFVEFNYAQARRKCSDFVRIGTSNLILNLSKYKLYEGYVGARYYFDRWCDRTSFFFGGKVGVIHNKRIRTGDFSGINANTIFLDCCTVSSDVHDLFRKKTSFAGGGHLGFDICFGGNWSFVITAEVIASCGAVGNTFLTLSLIDSVFLNNASSLIVPNAGTVLAFPITFGLKYNF